MKINDRYISEMEARELANIIEILKAEYMAKSTTNRKVRCPHCGKLFVRANPNDERTVYDLTPVCECGQGGII